MIHKPKNLQDRLTKFYENSNHCGLGKTDVLNLHLILMHHNNFSPGIIAENCLHLQIVLALESTLLNKISVSISKV